jgi:hypothetical protein
MAVTLNTKITQGFERVVALIKQVRDDNAGKIGTLSSLNTTAKGSLVQALNELKTDIGNFSQIDDGAPGAAKIWSSQKTQAEITAAIAALVSNAPGAQDTLGELAAQITALAQADTGLVSTGAAQIFSAAQQAQARANIGAVAGADVGDIATADFVTAINSAFAAA